MRGQVNDKAHMELILKSIDNVFEFTAKHETYEQFEADKICCHAVHIIYSALENLYIRCHRSLKMHTLILNGILSVG